MARGMLAVLLLAALATVCVSQNQFTCDQAIALHNYAVEQLETCMDTNVTSPLCNLIGQYEEASDVSPSNTTSEDNSMSDQLIFINDPTSDTGDSWQNYLIQATITQFADLGEIAYILDQVNQSYSNFEEPVSNDDYFAAWQQPWWQQARQNLAIADAESSNNDPLSKAETYWKAANYFFTGVWPFAFSDDSLAAATSYVDAFQKGLDAHPRYRGFTFTTPFNNGTATANLRGIMITPDPTRALPLLILTGGTDYPKEMNVLQSATASLDRGYAILVYDGPGQGEVIRNAPFMPFYARWDLVLSEILDYVNANFGQYVQYGNIGQMGLSLGGYLSGRACAGQSDRLATCVPNPPNTDITPIYDNQFSSGISNGLYGPFTFVGQENASLMPNGYGASFQNSSGIINTLLLVCNASSGAPRLVAEAFRGQGGPVDPEIVYLAGGYGGIVTGDTEALYEGVWQGYRNVQAFGTYDIANITCPVIGIKGTQDNLLGGSEDEFFAQLDPSVADESTLITFDAASGGALHDQVGSVYALAAKLYPLLNPIMMNTANSPNSAPPSPNAAGSNASPPSSTSG